MVGGDGFVLAVIRLSSLDRLAAFNRPRRELVRPVHPEQRTKAFRQGPSSCSPSSEGPQCLSLESGLSMCSEPEEKGEHGTMRTRLYLTILWLCLALSISFFVAVGLPSEQGKAPLPTSFSG
jgi:hypothetical protein